MSTGQRRVAITGLGLVTPAGNDVASTWDALLAARSGVAPIASFDASGFPVRIAAGQGPAEGRLSRLRRSQAVKFANRAPLR
jgi:3-oxoacyl-(acyl-carrier-protein) synthase